MSWNLSTRLNPELVRGLRTTLPRRRALFVAGLTAALLAAGAWVVWNQWSPRWYAVTGDPSERIARLHELHVIEFGRASFLVLMVTLFALLFMLGPAMAGLSFVQERLRGTAVFQQLGLLSPFRLAAGKFWGAGALAYFVALMILPCSVGAAWLAGWSPEESSPGGVTLAQLPRLYLFLFVGGFAWQALGLYASAALCGHSERGMRGGLLVGPVVAACGAVTALVLAHFFTADYEGMRALLDSFAAVDARGKYLYDNYESYWWHFYGVRVPSYAVLLGLLAFAGLWAFAGAVRRVKVWQLIPVGARVPWLFFVSAGAAVAGLLWGRHPDDLPPVDRLQMFTLLGWAAVTAAAGASVLTRGRLREWWSAERDPLALVQRAEIKASVTNVLVAAGVSLAGLCALWVSYHVDPSGARYGYHFATQFLPVALGFALTLVTTVAFVQFCAMFRFRLGGWAGVALLVLVYAFAGVAGAMIDGHDNTPALLNPVTYTEAVTRGDYFIDGRYDSVPDEYPDARAPEGYRRHGRVLIPNDYRPQHIAHYDTASATARGLAAQTALALLALTLAALKYRRTRRAMLRGSEA